MTPTKKTLEALVARADDAFDATRRRLRQWRPYRGAVVIVTYMGYGTTDTLRIRGRVLRDAHFVPALATHSAWRNLREFYKRLESDEVPFARLLARFQNTEQAVMVDREGYFNAEIALTEALPQAGWHSVEVQLLSPSPPMPTAAQAPVLVPPATANFGVISDIDDTVVHSNVLHKIKMLLDIARSNHHTRKPFKGVGAFYRALQRGVSGKDGNPIFYVSSSPWNLYAPLVDFLKLQNIPHGPLVLKDIGDHTLFNSSDHRTHKLAAVQHILDTYPSLQFILIGDSGEQDPEIYADVVSRYPNRIRAIYIRSIDVRAHRTRAIAALVEQVQRRKVPLVLAADSEAAALHAAENGFIAPADVHNVRADKRQDEEDDSAAPPSFLN